MLSQHNTLLDSHALCSHTWDAHAHASQLHTTPFHHTAPTTALIAKTDGRHPQRSTARVQASSELRTQMSPASQFQTEMERDRHSTCSLAESSAAWGLLMSVALQPSDGLALGAAGLSSKNLLRARAGSICERTEAPPAWRGRSPTFLGARPTCMGHPLTPQPLTPESFDVSTTRQSARRQGNFITTPYRHTLSSNLPPQGK